jgi:hypothetical protein
MGKNKKDKVIVYWSPWVHPDFQYNQMILDIKPKSLMSDIQKRRAINPIIPPNERTEHGKYQICSALHTFSKNMFIIKSPFNADIKINEDGSIIRDSEISNMFVERISSIENSYSVDFNFSFLFFSEESIKMTLTPAYLHDTSHSNSGFVAAGEYDVSNWLRPAPCIFQLWPGIKNLVIKEYEPLSYVKFDTDKDVELRQFKVTEDIVKMVNACGTVKFVKPLEPMNKLYDRFYNTGLKKAVLKEVKNNII